MKLSILQRLALFARHRYYLVFAIFAVLGAVSLFLTLRLSFDTDMMNLLPRKEPAVRAYIDALETFGSNTLMLVAVRIPEGAVAEPYEAFVDELAAGLSEIPDLRNVQHRIGDPEELLQTFFPKSVLFLDEGGRRALEERLSDEGIRKRVGELRRQLSTPQGIAAKQLSRLDPLGLADIFLGRVESSRGSLQVDWTSGYYLSRDHRMLLILAEPIQPPGNLPFNERLASQVDRVVDSALARWDEIAGAEPPPKPQVGVGGPHLTALGDSSLIKRDMILQIATAVPGVILLFLFVFRRIGTLAYALVPLFSGLLLTFGFAKLTVGSLSAATSAVAGLLAGLGIDFVIVSYGRYIEERRNGESLEAALLAVNGSTGRAVLIGAVTTTVTFYAFMVTDFVGLWQMGFLTGTGILFCVGSVFLLLPAMLAWSEDHHERRKTAPRLFLHSFGSDLVIRMSMRHRRLVLLVGLGLTVVAFALAFQLRFDESMKTMRPKGNRGIDVAVEVGRTFGSGFDSMTLVVSGKSPDEVIELAARASEGAAKLVRQGVLYGYNGVTSLIPPPGRQREALDWLAQGRQGTLDMDRVRATFAEAAAGQGMRPEAFEPGLGLLAKAVNLPGPIRVEDFQQTGQTELLLDRFLQKTDDGWKGAVYLYPPANLWRREAPPEAWRLAEQLGPQVSLVGTNVVNQIVRREVLKDAWVASILGFVLVEILLWLDFRSIRQTLFATTPLLIGLVWMVGAMVVLKLEMNFINIFVTTMIIGIGVDYGVHVLHRYREIRDLPDAEFERGLLETGKAVMAAAISTIWGFGSIMFSSYPGLVSTGKVAILGALACSLVTITLLPAVLSWRREKRMKDLAAGRPVSADEGF
jgi:predicted RND superfamily exporter protein